MSSLRKVSFGRFSPTVSQLILLLDDQHSVLRHGCVYSLAIMLEAPELKTLALKKLKLEMKGLPDSLRLIIQKKVIDSEVKRGDKELRESILRQVTNSLDELLVSSPDILDTTATLLRGP